jgi:hypothetical protein
MTEGNAQTCPICKLNDDRIIRENAGGFGELIRIRCPRCKEFIIAHFVEITAPDSVFGPQLSAWIRDRNEQSTKIPQITPDTLKDLKAGLPNYSAREKQIRLLQNIEHLSPCRSRRI